MKKNQMIAAIITAVMTITSATATAITAFAGSAAGTTGPYSEYDLNGLDPSTAETKPTMSLRRIELPINVAQNNPVQTIELTVSGAKLKYASTGIHVSYDNRLDVVPDEFGSYADTGRAGSKLGKNVRKGIQNDLFLATMCGENYGIDGVLWTFQLRLPEELNVGDEFPIEILYRNADGTADLFASVENDEASRLMEAWLFTNGIEQGYIRITEAEAETEAQEETPEEPAIEEETPIAEEIMVGDINGDSIINASDSSCILSTYALLQTGQNIELSEAQMKAADINNDSRVDSKDATDALRYYSYLSTGGTLSITDFLTA